MTFKPSFFLLLFVFSPVLASANYVDEAKPITLKQCYELSLKQSEKLAIQQQKIREAQARFRQSFSGVLPRISFDYTHTFKQGNAKTDEAVFTFTQPLFTGFKEFAAMEGSKAEGRQHSQELIRAKQLLFTDVSDAFYYYSLYQEHLKSTQAVVKVLEERMAELKKRVDLGRSRASELASSEARLRRAEADVEQISADMAVARELLEFLTGTVVLAIEEGGDLEFNTQGDEALVVYANQRPDVKAAKEALVVTQKKEAVALAGYSPKISLDGNYYTKKLVSSSADWDVGLKVEVPIFQGGENAGKLDEAKAVSEEAKQSLNETERIALLEIRQAYSRLDFALRRASALKKALDAADKNYQAQAADYRNNLVNNLDVLQGLADLEEVRSEYIAAANEAKRFYWQFKIKAGDLKDGDF